MENKYSWAEFLETDERIYNWLSEHAYFDNKCVVWKKIKEDC